MRTRRLGLLVGVTALLIASLSDRLQPSSAVNAITRPNSTDKTHVHSASGANAAQQLPGGPDSFLPLTVDGSVTPELVPDRLAYYHFIIANAQRSAPTANDIRRREIRLGRLGLDNADHQALVTALTGVQDALDQAQALGRGPSPDHAAAKTQKDEVLEAIQARLGSVLTNDGSSRLDAFIQNHVKRGIKIYGAVRE